MHPAGSWNLTGKFVTDDDDDADNGDGENDDLPLESEVREHPLNVLCGVSVASALFNHRLILSKGYRAGKALLGLIISQPSARAKLVKQSHHV